MGDKSKGNGKRANKITQANINDGISEVYGNDSKNHKKKKHSISNLDITEKSDSIQPKTIAISLSNNSLEKKSQKNENIKPVEINGSYHDKTLESMIDKSFLESNKRIKTKQNNAISKNFATKISEKNLIKIQAKSSETRAEESESMFDKNYDNTPKTFKERVISGATRDRLPTGFRDTEKSFHDAYQKSWKATENQFDKMLAADEAAQVNFSIAKGHFKNMMTAIGAVMDIKNLFTTIDSKTTSLGEMKDSFAGEITELNKFNVERSEGLSENHRHAVLQEDYLNQHEIEKAQTETVSKYTIDKADKVFYGGMKIATEEFGKCVLSCLKAIGKTIETPGIALSTAAMALVTAVTRFVDVATQSILFTANLGCNMAFKLCKVGAQLGVGMYNKATDIVKAVHDNILNPIKECLTSIVKWCGSQVGKGYTKIKEACSFGLEYVNDLSKTAKNQGFEYASAAFEKAGKVPQKIADGLDRALSQLPGIKDFGQEIKNITRGGIGY